MTEQEVIEEVGLIRAEDTWPLWPVLPVKNLNRGSKGYPKDEELGVMVAGAGPRVYLKNVYKLKAGLLAPQLEDVRTLEFDTYEELVKSGWVGD